MSRTLSASTNKPYGVARVRNSLARTIIRANLVARRCRLGGPSATDLTCLTADNGN